MAQTEKEHGNAVNVVQISKFCIEFLIADRI